MTARNETGEVRRTHKLLCEAMHQTAQGQLWKILAALAADVNAPLQDLIPLSVVLTSGGLPISLHTNLSRILSSLPLV